jgi:hypothetical protein
MVNAVSTRVEGFVVEGNLSLSGVVDDTIPTSVVRCSEKHAPALKLTHNRRVDGRLAGNMVFYMSQSRQKVSDVLKAVTQLGHRPAVFPEAEFLRRSHRPTSGRGGRFEQLFEIADRHAERRKVQAHRIDSLCLPVLGSRFQIGGTEFVPALVLCRYCGHDGYELLSQKEIEETHPAWLFPIVA